MDALRQIAGIGWKDGKPVALDFLGATEIKQESSFEQLILDWNNDGTEGVLFWDLSEDDNGHEACIGQLKELARLSDIPLIAGGRVRRLEDVKKYLYAGAGMVFFDSADARQMERIEEAAARFGKEKMAVVWSEKQPVPTEKMEEWKRMGASRLIIGEAGQKVTDDTSLSSTGEADQKATDDSSLGSTGEAEQNGAEEPINQQDHQNQPNQQNQSNQPNQQNQSNQPNQPNQPKPILPITLLRSSLYAPSAPREVLHSSVTWDQLKTNGDSLVPVIVQDYRTDEVLMLAYMNEQAYRDTLRTGLMHYYSRSRGTQWLKGETSGHYQYVKALKLDCDNDTLLARVHQIGAACHTGNRSCFFRTLAEKESRETNPLKVFEQVFAVIQDRKIHPREGSYTNYLFDKGIDKILKKVGEEATEIVIAAKNPDPEEIKYEISDFLYHVMVLMAEKGVTWEDITRELANR